MAAERSVNFADGVRLAKSRKKPLEETYRVFTETFVLMNQRLESIGVVAKLSDTTPQQLEVSTPLGLINVELGFCFNGESLLGMAQFHDFQDVNGITQKRPLLGITFDGWTEWVDMNGKEMDSTFDGDLAQKEFGGIATSLVAKQLQNATLKSNEYRLNLAS